MQSLKEILDKRDKLKTLKKEEIAHVVAISMDEHDAKWLKAKQSVRDMPNKYLDVLDQQADKLRTRKIKGGFCHEVTLFSEGKIDVELSVQATEDFSKVKPYIYAWDNLKARCFIRNLSLPDF